jgi:cell division protein FtsX
VTNEQTRAHEAPAQSQLSLRKLVRMSVRSLKHHFVGSLLQMCTVAATAAFLTFVLGEILIARAARELPDATDAAHGKMAELVWMLAVALLVCTISNVTSMLLSVTKRFREIGTMKCLGAFDRSILVLFLIEASILGGAGALAGSVVGLIGTLLAALLRYGAAIASPGLLGGLVLCSLVTVAVVAVLSFAGAAFPAAQASRMLPIEAMRKV